MKRHLIVFLFAFIIFPCNVGAKNDISIECDKSEIYNNQEIECLIKANNLEDAITSISGKVKVTDNLEIISSSYDEEKWLMLDNEFTVKDINLISEEIELDDSIIIATFKIKSMNKKEMIENIIMEDIILGDENYNEHKKEQVNVLLKLKYAEKYDLDNQQNKTILIVVTCLIIIIIFIFIFICYIYKKKKKEDIL